LDGGWRHWVLDQPWWKQLLVMVAMQTSFYMDDLITLLWLGLSILSPHCQQNFSTLANALAQFW